MLTATTPLGGVAPAASPGALAVTALSGIDRTDTTAVAMIARENIDDPSSSWR
ncbi:hypothetical protein [Actinoplanes palleronii]|uniref:hypothetical protein n=1 Tax=Actinoplanes palleronii TaxID=113570 RepID=UPI001942B0B4|nr:hypothetical protein [Actinoplanes palleronii]